VNKAGGRLSKCLAAAAVIVLAAAAAACSKVSSGPTGSASNPWTIPGLLRIGVRYPPDNLDPLLGQQQIDAEMSVFWAGYLFDYDDGNELVPDLAAVVPTLANGGISKDGKTITYHLRHGVTWQDGKPFTADDVVFTYRVVMDPNNPVPTRVGYELIDSVDKVDDYTVVVRLRRPYAPFVVTFLATPATYPYCVLPQHLFGGSTNIAHSSYNTLPVGTGPFRVTHYEQGSEVDLTANEHYWRGRPGLKEVQWRIVANDNTLLTLMKTHEIDLYYRLPHVYRQQFADAPGETVVHAPFTRLVDIGFNTASPIVADVRVRQALAYATDRQSIIDKVTQGAGMLTDSDQPPYIWAYDPNAPKYPYDPKKATALLDAAGWKLGAGGMRVKDGVQLRLGLAGISGDAESMTMREMLQAQWQQVGVATEIKSYPSDILYGPLAAGGIEQSGHFEVILEGFANGSDPDDSVLFECRWRPPAGQNDYHFCDRQLDSLEEHALATNDTTERKAEYARIQEILGRQLPMYVLYFEQYEFAVNSDLRGLKPAHVNAALWDPWEYRI
jgi:peptide/nickel transport system substrate-binding protein